VIWLPPKIWSLVGFSVQVQRTGSKLLQSWKNSPEDSSMFDMARVVNISTSSAPHLMLLFLCSSSTLSAPCSPCYARRSCFSFRDSPFLHHQCLNPWRHPLVTLNAIPKVLAFIHRQTFSMGRWDANEQCSKRVKDHRYKLLNKADQPLKFTSYIHQWYSPSDAQVRLCPWS
jgi:hypothetical protein